MNASPSDQVAPRSDRHQLAAQIKQRARESGFDLVGIAPAERSRHADFFRQWLDDGREGTMRYLADRFEERVDPGTYLPGARSIICVAINYHVTLQDLPAEQREDRGRVARYALGDDYHDLIKPRLHALADWLVQQAPGAQTRACVDTAPPMEKQLAASAGIGWFGKNSCVIHSQMGSWLLLGELVTTLDLPADDPAVDRCGTCRRCIDACPTGAITQAYQLDARRCISYLTIEHRQEIPAEFHQAIGSWLYGCDICQEVCPWNRRAPQATDPQLQPRFPTGTLNLHELLNWREEDYRRQLKGSAMKRVKLPVLQRTARIVEENLKRSS